jgi:hypothetical protein
MSVRARILSAGCVGSGKAIMGALADAVVLIHLLWIVLVLIGVVWTRGRPVWTAVHLACLVWGIIVEVGPWPCPLTMLEDFLDARAGAQAVGGSFILHWVQALIYPNAPYWLVSTFGVTACSIILAIYAWRAWVWWAKRHSRA